MTQFQIPPKNKTLIILIVSALLWWSLSCTYDSLESPKLPIFYQTINLPLVDAKLPLSGLRDTTNGIWGDPLSDSLYFKFVGELDTVTLTEDMFVIPTATEVAFQQAFADIGSAGDPVTISMSEKFRLATIFGLPLPQPNEYIVTPIPVTDLTYPDSPFEIFDNDGIPYFERVDYLTIGEGEFNTAVENEMLMDLNSVLVQIKNKDGSIVAESFYDTVPAGETRSDSYNLSGKRMMDSIYVSMSMTVAGTDGALLTVPANADPYFNLTIGISISEIESFSGKAEPIEMRQTQPLPESNSTIIRGILAEIPSLSPDTNQISWEIDNTLPINMKMAITFLNFYSETGVLTMEALLNSGEITQSTQRLDLDTLRNPDQTTVVDSIIVSTIIEIPPDAGDTVSTIPLNLSGALDFAFTISVLKCKEIVGFIDESFDMPGISISDIPSGFGDVNFGQVLLNLHIFNEIQAQTDLDFIIEGLKEGEESEIVTSRQTIYKATDAVPIMQSDLAIDITSIFNMVPDTMIVSGGASISGTDTARLQINKSFWGFYEVIVPFVMQINDMTFIPVTSTKLAAMDAETRDRIETGLIRAAIITNVTNDFPLSGSVDILISNYDYFPLTPDSVDSGYQVINDTIFAISDTGNIMVKIDTLVKIELPQAILDLQNHVKTPGVLEHINEISKYLVRIMISDTVHYIRPRIHFNKTEDFMFIGYNDEIDITSIFSLTLESGSFLGLSGGEGDSLQKSGP